MCTTRALNQGCKPNEPSLEYRAQSGRSDAAFRPKIVIIFADEHALAFDVNQQKSGQLSGEPDALWRHILLCVNCGRRMTCIVPRWWPRGLAPSEAQEEDRNVRIRPHGVAGDGKLPLSVRHEFIYPLWRS